tara:strand:+ start:768 stop:1697 length:930 start_codon:yes stop_codon:yes gene_type:complete
MSQGSRLQVLKSINSKSYYLTLFFSIVFALCIAALASPLSDFLHYWIHILWQWAQPFISISSEELIYTGVLLVGIYVAYKKIEQHGSVFMRLRHLEELGQKTRQPKVIIMICSPLDSSNMKLIMQRNGQFGYYLKYNDKESQINFKGELEQDINLIDEYFKTEKGYINWQQTLRGLNGQTDNLEKIILVHSQEMEIKTHGGRDIDRLKAWLESYNQDTKTQFNVKAHDTPVNKDSIKEYYRAFDKIIQTESQNYDERDIVLNITGGQIPASVAGSLATLHNNVIMQYINNAGHCNTYEMTLKEQHTPST